MSITITIDNNQSTTGTIDKLTLDESSGLQTPGTTDTGNDSNLDLADATTGNPDSNLFDGVLSGFATSFNTFLNGSTIFGYSGLRLSDVQKAYAAGVEGAISATDFVKVTTTAGETISDLHFSDPTGHPLDGDQVVGMQTLDGSNVYLWSDGDYCIATTSSTAGAGRVVAAFYLKDDATGHLSAQIQMATFEPLMHPDGTNSDDALDFTNVLNVSATGTLSFNFDNLASGSFLWAAVGSSSAGLLVTGQDLNVIDTASKLGDMVKGGSDPSDSVNTSQGGIGATIGINSQHFADQSSGGTKIDGPTAVCTLVTGFVPLQNATQATGGNVNQIDYNNYINAPSAKIFISQTTGSSSLGATMKITLWEAGGSDGGAADHAPGALVPEEKYGSGLNAYIGNQDTDSNVTDDWAVAVGAVTVTRGGTTYTFTGSGGTQAGITVSISGNSIILSGITTADTIGFAAADDPANPLDGSFNRFDVQALAGTNPFDIGRIDLDQGVSITQAVGGDLVVQDDGPSIIGTLTGAPSLTVDDSSLGTDDTKDFSGQFTPTYGTDGTGSTAVTYALSTPGGNSGIIDTGTGNPVYLFLESGKIVGREGTSALDAATGDIVFEVSVDSSGNVKLDQKRAAGHLPDSGTDQSATLSSAGLVVLTATAHDGDTDTAATSLNIGTLLNFKDDAPAITAQILDGTVEFANDATGSVSHSLNGSIGADVISTVSQAGVKEYTITSWTEPHSVYGDLDGVLSTDGTKVTYYSTSVTADQNATTAVYELSLNQTANSGAGAYTFTVLKPPPIVESNFGFEDFPSGQNLAGVIAVHKNNVDDNGTPANPADDFLPDGGLLVFSNNMDINDGEAGETTDGTMTNTSGTVNTSKGGGGVTIGNTNQAFDHAGEGSFFCYVDNPVTSAVGTLGLTQVTADDADTIKFNDTNVATTASVEIVQASGRGTTKSPGPAMHIFAYDVNPGNVDTSAESRGFLLDPTAGATESNIIGVKIYDANHNLIEYRTNLDAGATNNGALGGGTSDSAVGIQFVLDSGGSTPGDLTDDIYSTLVSNLKANYTIEFITEAGHDLALVENVSGSFDIGGFNVKNSVNVPAQDFDFSVQITDYDNDVDGGQSVAFANFGVTIDGILF